MRFWKGECSRAFTDWRGLHFRVTDGVWLIADDNVGDVSDPYVAATRS
jgi:hypothetical protein